MASSLALISHEDGSIEAIPASEQKLQVGSGRLLELIQQNGAELRFRRPALMREIKIWRDLEGILADSADDPNRDLEQEHRMELDRDAG